MYLLSFKEVLQLKKRKKLNLEFKIFFYLVFMMVSNLDHLVIFFNFLSNFFQKFLLKKKNPLHLKN